MSEPIRASTYIKQVQERDAENSGVRYHIEDMNDDTLTGTPATNSNLKRNGDIELQLRVDQETPAVDDHHQFPSPRRPSNSASNGSNDDTIKSSQNGKGASGMKPTPSISDLQRLQRQKSFLEYDDNVRTVLVWKNLTVTTPIRGSNQQKVLLNGVSGSMTGGLWAIMGPSGCGKSTLLNTLACRLDVNVTVTGEMRLNGRPYQNTELKQMSGYVMQDDLLNPNLTVRETLHYTAELRLPQSFNESERNARVNEVISEMGLLNCVDVIVGDPSKKGISGGERRRVCIGMELLTRPTLLFLDEPTSGLDSVTALALIQLLQRITRSGKCSMMISIHQPQAKLFQLFDRLLLLKSGRILFQGSIPAALQLFEQCGFPVPFYSNPADHILDVITPPMDLAAAASQAKDAAMEAELARRSGHLGRAALDIEIASAVQEDQVAPELMALEDRIGENTPLGRALTARRKMSMKAADEYEQQAVANGLSSSSDSTLRPDQANEAMLLATFKQPQIDLGYGLNKPLILERDQVSWWRQLKILMQRNVKENLRKKATIYTGIIQTIIMAVLIGTVFLRIGTGQSSTIRRQPVLFFVCVNQGMFGSLAIINAFPAERALMLRERAAGTYYASAYFIAKTTVDTIMTLHIPIIFSLITYFLIGFQPVASKFIIYLIIMILCNIAATSLALMVSALCRTTDLSVTILPMALELCRLFGAFFLSPANVPKHFEWLDALSYVQYSYVGVSLNELHGLDLHCNDSELKNGVCPYTSGHQFIQSLGLDYISLGGCIGVLIGYITFCRVVAFIAVRYLKTN